MWQTDRISDAYAILSDKNRYFADRTSRLLFNYSLFWFNIYTRPRSFWSNFWSLFIMAFCWPVLYWHLYMLLQFFQDLLEIAFVPSLILHFQFTFSIKIILLDKSNWSLWVNDQPNATNHSARKLTGLMLTGKVTVVCVKLTCVSVAHFRKFLEF